MTQDEYLKELNKAFGDFKFYEENHTYTYKGKPISIGATGLIEQYTQDFDAQAVAERVAEKQGKLVQEILDEVDNSLHLDTKPSVILVVGVNGVGKTTSIGKIANNLREQGKKVVVAAADTFRAAAVEQLDIWAKRANVDIVKKEEGADPAAVVYDSIQFARKNDTDVLIIDTAGRLHNKKNLMAELEKMNRIIDREFPNAHRENFIVLDATTGQNALNQAKEFASVAPLTGIVLTKMDGTAKGGIAIAIQSELNVPVKYIGVGESIDDLQKFDPDAFVEALFDSMGHDSEKEE